ncbi:hypothetical protein HK097_001633 [Rhizophlyctis rosea]|uniref:Uncharacterized protein n=1 Tax=Rhizophlyctis rosea TaxID=64517 RepID=A0AAD5SGX7_9FUNG|nr:hypothetical protein HK097_001633 [Rhizophlyctis rosea]
MTKLNHQNHAAFDLLNDPATVADDLFAEVGFVVNAIKPNIVSHKTFASFISSTNDLRENLEEAKSSFRTLSAETESAAHAVNLLTKTLPGPSPRKFPATPTPDSSKISDTDSFILDTHFRISPSPSRSSTPVPRMGVGSDLSISSDHEEKPHGQHQHSDVTRVILWLCGRYFTPRKFILSTCLTLILLVVVAFKYYDERRARLRIV